MGWRGERRRKTKKEGGKGRSALILFLVPGNRPDLSSLVRPTGQALSRKQPGGRSRSRIRAPMEEPGVPVRPETGLPEAPQSSSRLVIKSEPWASDRTSL